MFVSRLRMSAVVLGLVAVAACQKTGETPQGGTTGTGTQTPAGGGTGPVARVNGKDITRDAFNRQMDRTRQRFQQAKREIPAALEVRLKENIIRKLVDDELVNQRAAAEQVSLTDAEVDAKLNEHRGRFGSPEAFKNFLERTGQSEADLREELRRTELRDRLFAKLAAVEEPSDEEVKDFYEKNKERYKDREQANAIQIFWKLDKQDTPEKKKQVEASVKKAATELKKKGVDFKTQAAKYSDATPSPNGGDLGWFTKGRHVKQVEDAVFDPKVKGGEVLGPIESPFGYHIIKVNERKAENQRPLEEVAPAIKQAIKARKKSEKTREVLTSLKKDAKIEVLEPGVSLEPQALPPPPGAPGGGGPGGAQPIQLAPSGQGQPMQAIPLKPGQPAQPAPGQPQQPAPNPQ